MSTENTAPCLKCQSSISTGAKRCPECGYEPKSIGDSKRKARFYLSLVLTMTIVGAILGVPGMIVQKRRSEKAKQRKPTDYDPDSGTFL